MRTLGPTPTPTACRTLQIQFIIALHVDFIQLSQPNFFFYRAIAIVCDGSIPMLAAITSSNTNTKQRHQ